MAWSRGWLTVGMLAFVLVGCANGDTTVATTTAPAATSVPTTVATTTPDGEISPPPPPSATPFSTEPPAPTAAVTPTPEAVTSVPAASATSEAGTSVPAASATSEAGTSVPAVSATVASTSVPATAEATTEVATASPARFSYPIAWPGGIAGDGFFMRHGFDTENTWYNPGYWHTGEDWYALEGDTAGAHVRAIADGEVVYAGSNYPGRVVIVRHADDLVSMYGHLDPALEVAEGQTVVRGALLGTVLRRGDATPNHLHFEVRTFVYADAVNGDTPRYDFRCGPRCPPGPGYWPIDAPELPDALGWRNPTHTIAARGGWTATGDDSVVGQVVVAAGVLSPTVALGGALDAAGAPSQAAGEVALAAGARFDVLDVRAGPETPQTTSSTAYRVWYRLLLPDGRTGWVAALGADTTDRGSDGAPSSVRFNFLPTTP